MPAEPAATPSAPTPRQAPPVLAPFAVALADHLGVDAIDDVDGVLALAGVAAHDVVRPAAPIVAYLLGAAATSRPDRPMTSIAAEIEAFIHTWTATTRPG